MRLQWHRSIACAALALTATIGSGCDREQDRVQATASLAASPAGGRAAAAAQFVRLMAAGKVTTETMIDSAWNAVDQAAAGTNAQASIDATTFAGAVLDAIAAREPELLKQVGGGEFELFWMKVGGLAYKAAEEAHAKGRVAEALTLVFGGGGRWQTEAYWNRQSHHDAVAALVLFKSGQRAQAVQRLESRADLQPPATDVLAAIRAAR
ncbi:MAG: hypothetical protein HEQ23_04115 [Tepidisphaera sp.]